MKKILAALLGLAIVIAVILCLLPLKEIVFEGNSFYSDEEMREFILNGKSDKALAFRFRERMTPHPEIPFVQKYKVSFDGLRKARVHVYEKSMAGYLRFQNFYLYFDFDGVLIESSSELLPGLYEVTGLNVSHAVVGEKLPVEDPLTFRTIMAVTQYLDSENVVWEGKLQPMSRLAQKIRFGSAGVSVIFGDVTVLLGANENLEAKLALMSDMLPELSGMSGTLYLDSYKEGEAHPSYVFK